MKFILWVNLDNVTYNMIGMIGWQLGGGWKVRAVLEYRLGELWFLLGGTESVV